ncbi:MAG: hypothetical protein EPO26_11185 [Chloroflexota bacterium]|nr:MAG: hypothetical protein EPO26_11185 [Chloroflexota bacterium]
MGDAPRSTPPKPLPQPEPLALPYWDSLKERAMRLQRCRGCERFVFYPRAVCPHCGGRDLAWQRVSGRGRLHSFCIPHRNPNPAFQPDLPYVVALVELDEGVRLLTNLVDVEPDPAKLMSLIDKAVEVVYDPVSNDVTLPRFRPA